METSEQKMSSRQTGQEELVKKAQKQPGVAEAMAAYRAFAPYVAPPAAAVRPTVSYATGGKAPAHPANA